MFPLLYPMNNLENSPKKNVFTVGVSQAKKNIASLVMVLMCLMVLIEKIIAKVMFRGMYCLVVLSVIERKGICHTRTLTYGERE